MLNFREAFDAIFSCVFVFPTPSLFKYIYGDWKKWEQKKMPVVCMEDVFYDATFYFYVLMSHTIPPPCL